MRRGATICGCLLVASVLLVTAGETTEVGSDDAYEAMRMHPEAAEADMSELVEYSKFGLRGILKKTQAKARAVVRNILRRRRIKAGWLTKLSKKAAPSKVVGGKVRSPGYTTKDSYRIGARYILGPSRRRIGAGFGRRRRTKVHLSAPKGLLHRMLANRYTFRNKSGRRKGVKGSLLWPSLPKRKKGRKLSCSPCVKMFVKNGGCQAMSFSGKSTKRFLPPGCVHCKLAANAHCLFLKKNVREIVVKKGQSSRGPWFSGTKSRKAKSRKAKSRRRSLSFRKQLRKLFRKKNKRKSGGKSRRKSRRKPRRKPRRKSRLSFRNRIRELFRKTNRKKRKSRSKSRRKSRRRSRRKSRRGRFNGRRRFVSHYIRRGFLGRYYTNVRNLSNVAQAQARTRGRPSSTRIVPRIQYGNSQWLKINRNLRDNFVAKFTGRQGIPRSGWYTFWTGSDDGSKLWVNNKLVVNNDGLHGTRWRSGRIYLRQGSASIKVLFFERGGGATLYVDWAGPGFRRHRMTWRSSRRSARSRSHGGKRTQAHLARKRAMEMRTKARKARRALTRRV